MPNRNTDPSANPHRPYTQKTQEWERQRLQAKRNEQFRLDQERIFREQEEERGARARQKEERQKKAKKQDSKNKPYQTDSPEPGAWKQASALVGIISFIVVVIIGVPGKRK